MTEQITGKCWIMRASGVPTGPYDSPQQAHKDLREGDEIIPFFEPAETPDERRKNFQRQLVRKKLLSEKDFFTRWGERP